MSGIRIKQVRILNGSVVAENISDVLALDYLEELAALQYRISQDCTNAFMTQAGIIRENGSGLLDVFTVVVA